MKFQKTNIKYQIGRTAYCLLPTLFFIASLSSCVPSEFKNEVTAIDSLQMIIKNTSAKFEMSDLEKIKEASEKISKNLTLLQNFYKDTMDRETSFLFSDYQKAGKFFGKALKQQAALKKEIDYSKKQLENLKAIVLEHSVSKPVFWGYLGTESKAVNELANMNVFTKETVEYELKQFETMHPKIEKIVSKLAIPKDFKMEENEEQGEDD